MRARSIAPWLLAMCGCARSSGPTAPSQSATPSATRAAASEVSVPAVPARTAPPPLDDALLEQLLLEQARVRPYLVASSTDGELSVPDEDVTMLLEYAGSLFQTHTGEATARVLRGDGQRYLRAAWLSRRAEEAASGRATIVRIPLEACVGWGCSVPSDFVAVDCFGPAVFFVEPVGDTTRVDECRRCLALDDEARAECEPTICRFVAEGWFTGASMSPQPDGEPCGTAWAFHIDRAGDIPGPGFEVVAR